MRYKIELNIDSLGKNTTLSELGRDEFVDRVLLVVAIESEYDVIIHDDERDSWKILDDVAKTIFKKEHKVC